MRCFASGLPLIAYNVPGRTAASRPETIGRLVDAGAIAGVKDATGNLRRATETLSVVGSRPRTLSGDDYDSSVSRGRRARCHQRRLESDSARRVP